MEQQSDDLMPDNDEDVAVCEISVAALAMLTCAATTLVDVFEGIEDGTAPVSQADLLNRMMEGRLAEVIDAKNTDDGIESRNAISDPLMIAMEEAFDVLGVLEDAPDDGDGVDVTTDEQPPDEALAQTA